MKKILLIAISILAVTTLAACSNKAKEQAEGEQGASTEEYQAYDTHLQAIFEKSNNLLTAYSNTLDGLYTGSASNSQFAKVLKDNIITESSNLVLEVEKYDINPNFFELNQELVNYINQQHQLFLDSIDQANQDKMNKDNTRKSYLSVKETQATIINAWKQL